MPVQRLTMNDDFLFAEHGTVRLALLLPLFLLASGCRPAARARWSRSDGGALEVLVADSRFLLLFTLSICP